jgi:quinol monooxygenase YgiN
MQAPFIYITSHRVDDAGRAELPALLNDYHDVMAAEEPGLLAHHAYLNSDRTELTLVQMHRDAASAEEHMRATGHLIAAGTALAPTIRVQVYGRPGPMVRQALDRTARQGAQVIVADQPRLTFVRVG